MTKLTWGDLGSRFYELGIDQGVLYVDGQPGVAWNGLTAVTENSSGGDAKPYYIDGFKYSNNSSREEFEATITAFTYPDEFGLCDGTYQPRTGLFLTQQRRKPFNLSYRTKVGNDLNGDLGYKLHLIYNAIAAPSNRANKSAGNSVDLTDFSWNIKTRPPAISGYRPTSHIVIDSRTTDPEILAIVEDILYGTDADSPRFPTFDELIAAYDTISVITVTDNGDGTFTVTAPGDAIRMLDDETFEITSSTATFIDDDTYTISSTQ